MNSTSSATDSLLDRANDFYQSSPLILFSLLFLLVVFLFSLLTLVALCIKRRRRHTYRVSYRTPTFAASHPFESGTIRLTRAFSPSRFNQSDRFNTLPRHSIVRLPNSDTLIEYVESSPESSL